VSDQNQFRLLGQRRFAPFFATQFLGALNDNIFRNGLVILVTFQGVLVAGMNHSELANVAGALFILPFFLFSATAGQLADKYEKSMLMRRIKLLEITLMIIAAIAFTSGSYVVLLFVLFLMGCQSTLFGPVKYAYLPQQLDTHELIGGNALVEAGTYIAIILRRMPGYRRSHRLPGEPARTADACGGPGSDDQLERLVGNLANRRLCSGEARRISFHPRYLVVLVLRLGHDLAAAGLHAGNSERQ
jgi:hypothetical protein